MKSARKMVTFRSFQKATRAERERKRSSTNTVLGSSEMFSALILKFIKIKTHLSTTHTFNPDFVKSMSPSSLPTSSSENHFLSAISFLETRQQLLAVLLSGVTIS